MSLNHGFIWEMRVRIINARIAAKKLRLENPYVKDLIEVLQPRSNGLSRQLVLHTLERRRKTAGLSIPKKFEETVQSAYNQHCVDSSVFKKCGKPESEGLFYSPQGKGSGVWAVHRDKAAAWLRAHID